MVVLRRFYYKILFIYFIFKEINHQTVKANDFPSLLVANATVAILLDHEYLNKEYDDTLNGVKEIVETVLRENLRDGGGLNIKYFSWTQINFNKDFTAVISISNCENTWKSFLKAREQTLLYIALTDTDCPRLPVSEAIMIPILTVGDELPQIMLDIRATRAINWKTAILIYDDSFEPDSVSRMVNALSSQPDNRNMVALTISMFKINGKGKERDAIRNTLSSFSTNHVGKNFFVVSSSPKTVIDVASELKILDSLSQWLFVVSTTTKIKENITEIASVIPEGGNVAMAINASAETQCSSGKLCHFREVFKTFALSISKLINKESAIYGQISDEEWEAIRLTKRDRRDSMIEFIMENLLKNPMCSTCSKWIFKSAETWGLRYIPNKEMDKFNPLITEVGYWEPTNGLILNDTLFPHITYGFRNKTMPIVAYHNPPWQIMEYSETGDLISMRGIVIHILNELSEKLNFTYSIIDLSKEKNMSISITDFGSSDETNTTLLYESTLHLPPDVLNLLLNNKVLFAACGITVNEHYVKMINFTRPISVQAYTMLISRPKELGRLYLFTAPFSVDTWLCLTFTIIIIGPFLYGINYLTPYNDYFNLMKKGGLYKLSNCFWYIYGALLQQGGMYLPKSDSARLIVGTWWLVVLVVVTTYCGNLVAFLTFPKIDQPISTISQLIKYDNEITWSIRSETYLEDYLKETDSEKFRQLGRGAIFHQHETPEIIEQVRQGKHVYIDWKSNLQYIMKREFLIRDRCDFGLANEEFLDERIAVALPLNSPYLTIINKEIYRMLQMGFVQKWLTEYLPKKDRCWNTGKSIEIENHTVNLNDMQGCFLVLLTGTVAAIFIIIIECCWTQRTKFDDNKRVKPFTE